MKERYPFFREEAERTQAVIGEAGIDADLNGTFEKPYAVLTRERLYCKTQQGNFIAPADQILRAGRGGAPGMPSYGWILLVLAVFATLVMAVTVLCLAYDFRRPASVYLSMVLCLVLLAAAFVFFRKRPKLALIALVAYGVPYFPYLSWFTGLAYGLSVFQLLGFLYLAFSVVCLLLYLRHEKNVPYEIRHTGGAFCFRKLDYAPEELAAFTKAVAELRGGTQ